MHRSWIFFFPSSNHELFIIWNANHVVNDSGWSAAAKWIAFAIARVNCCQRYFCRIMYEHGIDLAWRSLNMIKIAKQKDTSLPYCFRFRQCINIDGARTLANISECSPLTTLPREVCFSLSFSIRVIRFSVKWIKILSWWKHLRALFDFPCEKRRCIWMGSIYEYWVESRDTYNMIAWSQPYTKDTRRTRHESQF